MGCACSFQPPADLIQACMQNNLEYVKLYLQTESPHAFDKIAIWHARQNLEILKIFLDFDRRLARDIARVTKTSLHADCAAILSSYPAVVDLLRSVENVMLAPENIKLVHAILDKHGLPDNFDYRALFNAFSQSKYTKTILLILSHPRSVVNWCEHPALKQVVSFPKEIFECIQTHVQQHKCTGFDPKYICLAAMKYFNADIVQHYLPLCEQEIVEFMVHNINYLRYDQCNWYKWVKIVQVVVERKYIVNNFNPKLHAILHINHLDYHLVTSLVSYKKGKFDVRLEQRFCETSHAYSYMTRIVRPYVQTVLAELPLPQDISNLILSDYVFG